MAIDVRIVGFVGMAYGVLALFGPLTAQLASLAFHEVVVGASLAFTAFVARRRCGDLARFKEEFFLGRFRRLDPDQRVLLFCDVH